MIFITEKALAQKPVRTPCVGLAQHGARRGCELMFP